MSEKVAAEIRQGLRLEVIHAEEELAKANERLSSFEERTGLK